MRKAASGKTAMARVKVTLTAKAMAMEELTEIHEEVFPLWEVPHGGVEAGSEKKAER